MTQPAPCVVDLITTETDRKFESVALIADAIINMTLQHGDCAPQRLRLAGFSSRQVIRHWHFAHALADVELKKMSNRFAAHTGRGLNYV